MKSDIVRNRHFRAFLTGDRDALRGEINRRGPAKTILPPHRKKRLHANPLSCPRAGEPGPKYSSRRGLRLVVSGRKHELRYISEMLAEASALGVMSNTFGKFDDVGETLRHRTN